MIGLTGRGGYRDNSGRKPDPRINIRIDLGKLPPSGNLDGLTMPELHGRRRQRRDAVVIANKCQQMLSDIGLSSNQQLNDMLQGLHDEIADLTSEIDTRNVSAARYTRAAFQREFEISALVAQARNRIKNGQADISRKQAELEKAGVSDVKIPPYDESEDLQIIDTLEAEASKWSRFQQTYLVRDLPENASEAVMRIGTYSSVTPHETA